MTYIRTAALAAILTFAVSSFAALSPKYQEWGEGPVRWIMTSDEQRQWKQLATDEDAEKFISLFWARRDPTPGTPVNEFKNDFESRVMVADQRYADVNSTGQVITRGSMSDRGRVLLVLGFPETLNLVGRQLGSNAEGAREIWIWEKEAAQKKFDLPRVEVVFVQDPKMVFHRDTQRHDFLNAAPAALRKMIVSPDLKDVPEWATPAAMAAAPQPGVKVLRKGEPGSHHLVLAKDPHSIVNSDDADPFADVPKPPVFAKTDDLGYVVDYCGEVDPVKVTVGIRGTLDGKRVNINAFPVKAHPDPIKTVPGCGLIRASVSLGDLPLGPGTFTFLVKVDDGTQTYNLTQEFTIQ